MPHFLQSEVRRNPRVDALGQRHQCPELVQTKASTSDSECDRHNITLLLFEF
jgi:hypothetical protein